MKRYLVFLFLAAFIFGCASSKFVYSKKEYEVVSKTDLREGPDVRYSSIVPIMAGDKAIAKMLKIDGEWAKVEIIKSTNKKQIGLKGFIEMKSLLPLVK